MKKMYQQIKSQITVQKFCIDRMVYNHHTISLVCLKELILIMVNQKNVIFTENKDFKNKTA